MAGPPQPSADGEINMLELDFTQTLGTHCLQICETLPASGITAVFGVSGAGKTSLINAISGLTRPQQGRIVLNGRVLNDVDKGICLAPEKRRIGYVFQDAPCFRTIKCAAICNMAWRSLWRRSLTSWWRCSALRRCLTACRAASPVGRSSGWRLAGRCLPRQAAAAG